MIVNPLVCILLHHAMHLLLPKFVTRSYCVLSTLPWAQPSDYNYSLVSVQFFSNFLHCASCRPHVTTNTSADKQPMADRWLFCLHNCVRTSLADFSRAATWSVLKVLKSNRFTAEEAKSGTLQHH